MFDFHPYLCIRNEIKTRYGAYRMFYAIFCVLAVVMFATVAGDGFISAEQRPERESWKYQLEMILGGW